MELRAQGLNGVSIHIQSNTLFHEIPFEQDISLVTLFAHGIAST